MAKKLWIGYRYAMDKLWIRIHGYIAMYIWLYIQQLDNPQIAMVIGKLTPEFRISLSRLRYVVLGVTPE